MLKIMLPEKIEGLVPLSFIGKAAIEFYRSKLKLMDQLNITEEQRKATLADGQDAGEMLLDIEGRIGELALQEKQVQAPPKFKGSGTGKRESGKPPKHERLNIPTARRMHQGVGGTTGGKRASGKPPKPIITKRQPNGQVLERKSRFKEKYQSDHLRVR